MKGSRHEDLKQLDQENEVTDERPIRLKSFDMKSNPYYPGNVHVRSNFKLKIKIITFLPVDVKTSESKDYGMEGSKLRGLEGAARLSEEDEDTDRT